MNEPCLICGALDGHYLVGVGRTNPHALFYALVVELDAMAWRDRRRRRD